MFKSKSLIETLQKAVSELIPKRHGYIIDVRGPDGMCSAQFVDEHRILNNWQFGICLYFAFDPTCPSGERDALAVMNDFPNFFRCDYQTIPCFARIFGCDAESAAQCYWRIATRIYYNADSMDLTCELSDEGSYKE